MTINEKAKKMASEIICMEKYYDMLEEQIEGHELTKLKHKSEKYVGALAITLTLGMGIGCINSAIYAKMQEATYYYTEAKIVANDTTYELAPNYQDKLEVGEDVLLLEYGPWEETVNNTAYEEYASDYTRNLYAYQVGDRNLSYEEYLQIDTTNLAGSLVDSTKSYIAPVDEDIQRFLVLLDQNLSDSILVSNKDNVDVVEKIIINVLFFLNAVGAGIAFGAFFSKLLDNILFDISPFEKVMLLDELKQLRNNYKICKKELSDAIKDLINLFNKYELEITDKETKELCQRLIRK